MPIEIRMATEADLPAIVEIYNSTIPTRLSTADTKPITVESRKGWFAKHNERRPLWVAVEGDTVVGYLSLRNHYGRPAYHITAEIAVYVHPDHRRKGAASMLMDHAIERSPSLGIENFLAIAFAHNEPSIAFFQRYGFKEHGRLPRVADLDGERADVVYLVRRL